MRSQQQMQQFHNQPVRAEKLVLQQHLQNKIQQQQLMRHLHQLQHLQQQQQQQQQQNQQQAHQQAQHLAFQQLNAKANLAAFLQAQPNNTTILDSATLTAINNKKNHNKNNGTTTVQMPTAIVLNLAKPTKLNGSILGALVAQAQSQQLVTNVEDGKPPPPQYEEAAKLLKVLYILCYILIYFVHFIY
jgi:acetyl-CoA carboxylase alpha subunit